MQEIRIGRSRENQIVLDDPSVSRHHATIIVNGNTYFVRDNGSTNGTFINGRRIQNEPLQVTDILKVGNVVVPWRNSVSGGGSGFPQGNAGYNQPYNNMPQGGAQQQAPYFPPPARKKSNTGLILGGVGILLVVIVVGVIFFIRNSSDKNRLVGEWECDYNCENGMVLTFEKDGDDLSYRVRSSDGTEKGEWSIREKSKEITLDPTGNNEWEPTQDFMYVLTKDELTLTLVYDDGSLADEDIILTKRK